MNKQILASFNSNLKFNDLSKGRTYQSYSNITAIPFEKTIYGSYWFSIFLPYFIYKKLRNHANSCFSLVKDFFPFLVNLESILKNRYKISFRHNKKKYF